MNNTFVYCNSYLRFKSLILKFLTFIELHVLKRQVLTLLFLNRC